MVQTTDKSDTDTLHSPSMTGTPFVEVTKEFNAPVEEVWKAWSDAELIKQWWGPEGYSSPSAKNDFRIEGKFLYAMKSPDGEVTWGTGTYLEILPLELIVCTDQFADEKGNVVPASEVMKSDDWIGADTCLFSVKFEKLDDKRTKIQLVHEGIPESMHDDCVHGWTSSLEKMKRLVEKQ